MILWQLKDYYFLFIFHIILYDSILHYHTAIIPREDINQCQDNQKMNWEMLL